MNPKLIPHWQTVRNALGKVKANLAEHQKIQAAAAAIESALLPKPRPRSRHR